MTRILFKISAIPLALAVALSAGVAGATSASADASYRVAWTQIGIYPKVAPSMDAERAAPALSDGDYVSIECETSGETVTSSVATTDIWERLSDGSYLPNAFIETGVNGWTPGVPRCDDGVVGADDSTPAEEPKEYDGIWISNDRVSTQLLNHYFDATGESVVIDWSYFESSERLLQEIVGLPQPDHYDVYQSNPYDDGDIYYSLGAFTIARTSEHCYAIKDSYDYAPDKLENIPYFNWVDARLGRAAEFDIHSSGCIY